MQPYTQKIARAGIIAALYAVLGLLFSASSFGIATPLGPLQFRPSEALTVLPILFPEAIWGVFIGCLITNLMSPIGWIDVILGSLTSLLAAYVTYRLRHSFLAYLSPIVLNAFLVSLYLHVFFNIPYWITVITIGASEAAVVILLGYPMNRLLSKSLSGRIDIK